MPEKARADDGLGFDNVPEIYDRVRPTYPPALFDQLFSYLRSDSELRAVEIGPATGKATRPLLEHGIAVTAVEPGEALSDFLRRKLGGEFSQLNVITAKFEDAELASGAFDLVLAATSFHWLDKETRFQKCHDVLRESGVLAIVHTNQIESEADGGFFAAVQPVYDRHEPRQPDSNILTSPELPTEYELQPPDYEGLVASGLFDDIQLYKYRWDQTYTTAAYGDLMRSYSGTQAMEPPQQEALIGDVCAVIDAEFGGSITRPLVMTLSLGRKS
jgi:SAM-dependent methyltransferase